MQEKLQQGGTGSCGENRGFHSGSCGTPRRHRQQQVQLELHAAPLPRLAPSCLSPTDTHLLLLSLHVKFQVSDHGPFIICLFLSSFSLLYAISFSFCSRFHPFLVLRTWYRSYLLHQTDSFKMTQILFNDLTLQIDFHSEMEAAI